MKKRLMAMLLSAAMILTLLPAMAFAEEPEQQVFKKVPEGIGFADGGQYLITTTVETTPATCSYEFAEGGTDKVTAWTFTNVSGNTYKISNTNKYLAASGEWNRGTGWKWAYSYNNIAQNGTGFTVTKNQDGTFTIYYRINDYGNHDAYLGNSGFSEQSAKVVLYDSSTGAEVTTMGNGTYYIAATTALSGEGEKTVKALKTTGTGLTSGDLKFTGTKTANAVYTIYGLTDTKSRNYPTTYTGVAVELTVAEDLITNTNGACVWTAKKDGDAGFVSLKNGSEYLRIGSGGLKPTDEISDNNHLKMDGNALYSSDYNTENKNERYLTFADGKFGGSKDESSAATITLYKKVELADPTPATVEAATGLKYTGADQALVNVTGTAANCTMKYSLDNETWSEDVPTGKNAGTYNVYVQAVGVAGYKTVAVNNGSPFVVTIGKADNKFTTSPEAVTNLVYDGSDRALIIAGVKKFGAPLYYVTTDDVETVADGWTWSESVPKGKNAGKYNVWYKIDEDTNGNYYGVEPDCVAVTIAPAELTGVSVSQTDTLTYTGEAQTATVSAYATTVDSTTATFTYYDTEEDTYTNTVPSFTDAGTYTVDYKVSAANHNDATGTFAVTIDKADNEFTTSPAAKSNLVYTGNNQKLIEEGVGKFGTPLYYVTTDDVVIANVSDDDWSRTVPTGKNADTYNVWYKIAEDTNYKGVASAYVTVTIAQKQQSSSSSGSGGSVSTPTVTVPVSGKNDSVKVQASVSGSTATVKELKSADAEKVAGGAIEIDLSGLNKTITAAKIPEKTVDEIADKGNLAVKLSTATVTFDAKATESISGQTAAGGLELKVETNTGSTAKLTAKQQEAIKGEEIDSQVVVNVSMLSGGKAVGSFNGGSATLKVPYTLKKDQSASGLCVFFIGSNGEVEKLPCFYVNGEVVFTVEHFSDYIIAYDAVAATVCPKDLTCLLSQFPDLRTTSWYHDGIHYCLEKGLMNGMPDGLFLPGGDTTRAQATSMLWRVMGSPAVNYELNFSDVRHGCWYEEAVRWATSEGIINGVNDTDFAPTDPVTREQFASMLYRLAQIKGEKFDGEWTLDFSDLARMRAWAHDAASWCNQKGIMAGLPDGTFQPRGNTTRAQAASMIQRFNEIILGK